MMRSQVHSNQGPEAQEGNSSSSSDNGNQRCSLMLQMEDGNCHDISNISFRATRPKKALYPHHKQVQRLRDIDVSHTLRLWEPIPRSDAPFHRSHTTSTCTLKENERVTPPREQRRASMAVAPLPVVPVQAPPVVQVPEETRAEVQVSTSTPPAVNEPGPRPKVNYKKLYGAGETCPTRDLRGSNRHISFQEQQLQKTLAEEERLRKEQEKGGSVETQTQTWPQSPVVEEEPEHQEEAPSMEPSPWVSRLTSPAPTPVQKTNKEDHSSYSPPTCQGTNSQTVMEIAPNLYVPYKGSHETWEAVQRGQFTVTTCFACTLQLVVIDTAEFLVCPDCHTVSPLSYGNSNVERCGVGLGIKREWCDTEAALPVGHTIERQTSIALQPFPTTTSTTTTSYTQRHQEKTAKYDRSPSPEQTGHYSDYDYRSTYQF